MPERGKELLGRLLRRYPDVRQAAMVLGKPAGTVAVWKHRGQVPPKEWDAVRAILSGPAARPLHVVPPLTPVIDSERARRLLEFVHLLLSAPGFKEILLGHSWAPEDRKVVADVIESVEEELE